jgi:hypothetical protein
VGAGNIIKYTLPSVMDPQNSFPVKFTNSYGSASTIIKFDFVTSTFTISPDANSKNQSFTIQIKLTNAISISSSAYSFTLNVFSLSHVNTSTETNSTETNSTDGNDTFDPSSLFN